ncbi:hypothetical protein RHMOL_Rhmol12G0017200 [Rhododendron molle]|uniref:Uncharacterized protein n=1 Tax=Rhododendron molle TaxID=49168 RepID=A0ACC0LDR4_RHOML|nr:hypothetical protein RHMOL_Rhmol12G0017200 [Rhododendron molle]
MVWKDIRAVYMNLRGTVLSLGELAATVLWWHNTEQHLPPTLSSLQLQDIELHWHKPGDMIQTVAKTAEMHRNEWVENADRWVAGFLEMFEEGCHKMGTAIRDRIQERLMGQQTGGLLQNGNEEDEYYDDDSDDYYDDEDEYYEEEKS